MDVVTLNKFVEGIVALNVDAGVHGLYNAVRLIFVGF